MQENGLRGFFTGLVPRILKVIKGQSTFWILRVQI
jgi:hypothetical protein